MLLLCVAYRLYGSLLELHAPLTLHSCSLGCWPAPFSALLTCSGQGLQCRLKQTMKHYVHVTNDIITHLTDDINLGANSGRRLLRSAVDRTCVVHAPTIRTATRVSLLLVRVCETVCHRTYDETFATDNLSEHWKHFCLGGNWPRRTVTFLLSVHVRNTLTYLLTCTAITAACGVSCQTLVLTTGATCVSVTCTDIGDFIQSTGSSLHTAAQEIPYFL